MSKTYFLANSRTTPPLGPIFLGSIIKSPRSPELSLNGKNSPLLKDLEIHTHIEKDSSRQLFKTDKGKAGVWAAFINGMGISGEVSGRFDNTETATYKFQQLVTRTIAPDFAEITAFFNEASVQAQIKKSRFRDNVYMITGVKIARGADVAIQKIRSRGGNLHFGIDSTPAGVPLTLGPDFELERSMGQEVKERHEVEEEFVFAYRVREIRYRRKVVESQAEVLKGDLFGKGKKERRERREADAESKAAAELVGLREEDVNGRAWDLEGEVAVDDDGRRLCAFCLMTRKKKIKSLMSIWDYVGHFGFVAPFSRKIHIVQPCLMTWL